MQNTLIHATNLRCAPNSSATRLNNLGPPPIGQPWLDISSMSATDKTISDHDGVELADHDEARTQAVIAAGEALRDTGRRFWNTGEWQMVVTDITGAMVCTLKFSATT